MAWTPDQENMAQAGNSASAVTLVVTTNAAVAAGAWVFLACASSELLSSVSGGCLTWTVADTAGTSGVHCVGIAYAYAPDGLSSGSSLTVTWAATADHRVVLGSSFTGGPVSLTPSASSGTTGTVAAWTSSTGPAAGATGDLTFGLCSRETDTGTNTPDGNTTELQDTANVGATNVSSHYRLASGSGNTPVGGTYSGAANWRSMAVSFPLGSPPQSARPDATDLSTGWAVTGAATHHEALADESDSTYSAVS